MVLAALSARLYEHERERNEQTKDVGRAGYEEGRGAMQDQFGKDRRPGTDMTARRNGEGMTGTCVRDRRGSTHKEDNTFLMRAA